MASNIWRKVCCCCILIVLKWRWPTRGDTKWMGRGQEWLATWKAVTPTSGPQRCISLRAASPYWPTWQAPHVHGKLRCRWQRTFSETNIQSPGEDVFRYSFNLKMNDHICRLRPVTNAYSEPNYPFYCCSPTRDRAPKWPLTSSSLTKILYFFSFLHVCSKPQHITLVLYDYPNYLSEAFIRTSLGALPKLPNTLLSTLFQTAW